MRNSTIESEFSFVAQIAAWPLAPGAYFNCLTKRRVRKFSMAITMAIS